MKAFRWISALMVLLLVLAACAPAATPAPTAAPNPTEAPAAQPPAQPTTAPQPSGPQLPDLGGREVAVAIENAYIPFNYIRLDNGQA